MPSGNKKYEIEKFILENFSKYQILRLSKVFDSNLLGNTLIVNWVNQIKNKENIFCANNNIFTQLVDDDTSKTILSVSSIDKDLKEVIDKAKSKIEKSTIVGSVISEKIKKANVKKIIFDRNGYKYHGRIKAVGDAIRAAEIQI